MKSYHEARAAATKTVEKLNDQFGPIFFSWAGAPTALWILERWNGIMRGDGEGI